MASLVCWASGLLQILKDKDVDATPSGPVVLLTGTAGRLRNLMVAHGKYIDDYKGFYVPDTKPLPEDPDANAAQQQENMTAVIAFARKLELFMAKRKGLKHVKELSDAR